MKKRLSLMLLFTLCLSVVCAKADTDRQYGLFTYRLKGNGTAIITAFDWESNNGQDVYVPNQIEGYTVSEIGPFAFSSSEATGVSYWRTRVGGTGNYVGQNVVIVLPNTITLISEKAFFCSKITSVTIPSSVQLIGPGAFAGCHNIVQHTVESGNNTYATIDGVLYDKVKKEVVAVPETKMINYAIPDGIRSIGPYAFFDLNMNGKSFMDMNEEDLALASEFMIGGKEFTFPSSVTKIGAYAFSFTKHEGGDDRPRYNFSNITEIDEYAFYEASGDIEDWGKLQKVGPHAFEGFIHHTSKVKSFPETLEEISEYSFANFGQSYLYYTPNDRISTIDLSNTKLTKIPSHAFEDLKYLDGYTTRGDPVLLLPETLVEIGEYAFSSLNNTSGAGELELHIPHSVKVIDDYAFANAGKIRLSIDIDMVLTNIGVGAFSDANLQTKSLTLPQNLQSIGSRAFYCNLETLSIPATVATIGNDVVNRNVTKLLVEAGSYAELYASENGIPTVGNEDTSWLDN